MGKIPDGRPLICADGHSIRPKEADGSHIAFDGGSYIMRADSTMVGHDGQVLRDAKGIPIKLTPDEKLIFSDDGRQYIRRAGGTVVDAATGELLRYPDGRPLQLRADGEKLRIVKVGKEYVERSDGTVVGPDGRLLMGADGQPIQIELGDRLIFGDDGQVYIQRADGTIIGPYGGVVREASGKPLKVLPGDKLVIGRDGQAYLQRADGTIVGVNLISHL